MDVFQGGGERRQQGSGQRVEEQPAHQIDVRGCGLLDGRPALGGQHHVRGAGILGAGFTAGQSALFHPAQLMGHPAAFPSDMGGQIAHPHTVLAGTAQRHQHVVVRQRQPGIGLQLPVHLVVHPQLDAHEGNPGALLFRAQPCRTAVS